MHYHSDNSQKIDINCHNEKTSRIKFEETIVGDFSLNRRCKKLYIKDVYEFINTIDIGNELVNQIVKVLENNNWEFEVMKHSYDYGGDIIAIKYLKEFNKETKIVIQSKNWSTSIDLRAVQEVQFAKEYYKCDEAWVIYKEDYTNSAYTGAKETGVCLYTFDEFKRKIEILNFLLTKNSAFPLNKLAKPWCRVIDVVTDVFYFNKRRYSGYRLGTIAKIEYFQWDYTEILKSGEILIVDVSDLTNLIKVLENWVNQGKPIENLIQIENPILSNTVTDNYIILDKYSLLDVYQNHFKIQVLKNEILHQVRYKLDGGKLLEN